MNYIYNILACLDKRCLDTFEWSNNEIVSINKTLLFRFDDATFLLNNNVIVSKDFLNKVYRILVGQDFGQQAQTPTKK